MISDTYRNMLRTEHAANADWGTGGKQWVQRWVESAAARIGARTLIDYGCGKGRLLMSLAATGLFERVRGYDPGIPGHDHEPQCSDMLVSTDVLEHVEPDHVSAVLAHCARLAPWGLHLIATGPARLILADGRNAHLVQKPGHWWQHRLRDPYTTAALLWQNDYHVMFLCSRRLRFQVKADPAGLDPITAITC